MYNTKHLLVYQKITCRAVPTSDNSPSSIPSAYEFKFFPVNTPFCCMSNHCSKFQFLLLNRTLWLVYTKKNTLLLHVRKGYKIITSLNKGLLPLFLCSKLATNLNAQSLSLTINGRAGD